MLQKMLSRKWTNNSYIGRKDLQNILSDKGYFYIELYKEIVHNFDNKKTRCKTYKGKWSE